jgi:hypothetical protein
MICIVCKKHASFEHTIFRGTSPVRVTLCPDCVQKTGAETHLAAMKGAADRDAKHAAADAFLKAVGK